MLPLDVRPLSLCTLAALALLSCGDSDEKAATPASLPSPFASSVTRVVLEVDYAPGAEPYAGTTAKGFTTWKLFADNAQKLFEGRGKQIVAPTTLGEMQAEQGVTGADFTSQQILDIARQHRDTASTADTAAYYAIWLDGYLRDEQGVRKDVLGVSLGSTRVIAMFKPVIRDAGATPGIEQFVEQTTLVHEFGHAIGLVNNGVAMAAPHQDAAHGAHCQNDRCVMYWANEGAADLIPFVVRFTKTGDTVLFGDECLADVRAAK